MKFNEVAELFEKIEGISSRNEITDELVSFMNKACISENWEEVQMVAYLFGGRVAPLFIDAEFNYSEKGLINLLEEYVKANSLEVNVVELRDNLGDIGLVCNEILMKNKSQGVSLDDVYEKLWSIVNTSGTGSQTVRGQIVASMVSEMNGLEVKYIARMIAGKLRLGVSNKTFLDALSVKLVGDKSLRENLDQLFGTTSDLGYTAKVALSTEVGDWVVDPIPGVPLSPRLVERVKDFGEVLERLGEGVLLQPKFDGIRGQIHKGVDSTSVIGKDRVWGEYFKEEGEGEISMFGGGEVEGGDVKIFSRRLEDLTDMFPDLVEQVRNLSCESCVLDCEILGINTETGDFVPFQETMTRKRKYDVSGAKASVPVKAYIFDVMELNGENLLNVDTSERIEKIDKVLGDNELLKSAETVYVSSVDEINNYFQSQVGSGLEGLIAKQLKGSYLPGVRNFEWIKLKKSMDSGLVDTVDVVIMGYYYGSGKKTEFGMGALLGGIYNEESGEIESVTKIGTGITDDQWREIASRLKGIESKEMSEKYVVDKELYPDIWLQPEVVCTVEADEVTRSKVHKAAMDKEGRGLALRFPRLIEFDRGVQITEATSVKELESMVK